MARFERYRQDERLLCFEKAHYICELEECNNHISNSFASGAHTIKNDETNRHKYGKYVMFCHCVLKAACCNEHNDKLELRQYKDSGEYKATLIKAILYVYGKNLPLGKESQRIFDELKRWNK